MSTYTNRWSASDKQAFADCKLRAQTIQGRRHPGPTPDEWDWEDDES